MEFLEFIGGLIVFVFFIGFIIFIIAFMNNPKETTKITTRILKEGAKKSINYTHNNTSKVRDYAIIIVCIAVIIALIAFFANNK